MRFCKPLVGSSNLSPGTAFPYCYGYHRNLAGSCTVLSRLERRQTAWWQRQTLVERVSHRRDSTVLKCRRKERHAARKSVRIDAGWNRNGAEVKMVRDITIIPQLGVPPAIAGRHLGTREAPHHPSHRNRTDR